MTFKQDELCDNGNTEADIEIYDLIAQNTIIINNNGNTEVDIDY